MKLKKKNLMLLWGAVSLLACTDSDYDLSKIAKDDILVGETVSGPMGSISLSTRDMVDIEGLLVKRIDCPETEVHDWKEGTGHVTMTEEKLFPMSFKSEPIVLTSDEVEDLVYVNLESGVLVIQLNPLGIIAEDAKSYVDITITMPDGWSIEGGGTVRTKRFSLLNDFQKGKNTLLIPVLSITPGDNRQIGVDIRMTLEDGALINVTRTPAFKAFAEIVDVEYTEVYAKIGTASVADTINNIFEQSLIDLLFSGGQVELSGTGRNDVQINLGLALTIASAKNIPVGVAIEKQNISGGATADPLKFVISASDIPKMKQARNLIVTATTQPSATPIIIKPNHSLILKLAFKKEGGVSISNL